MPWVRFARARARADRVKHPTKAPKSTRIIPEIPEIARTGAEDIARALLAGAESVQRIDAYLVRAEAADLAYISDGNRARVLGAPSVSKVADEILRIGKRTAAERIALHRIFTQSAPLERAFLDGRLSSCQVLALGPVIQRTGENHARWIDESSGVPVRQIRARVRVFLGNAASGTDRDDQEPEGTVFCFAAPIPFRIVWNEMMDLSRRVLGYDAPQYQCVEAILAEAGVSGACEADMDGKTPGAGAPLDPRQVAGRSGGSVSGERGKHVPGRIANHLAVTGVVPSPSARSGVAPFRRTRSHSPTRRWTSLIDTCGISVSLGKEQPRQTPSRLSIICGRSTRFERPCGRFSPAS